MQRIFHLFFVPIFTVILLFIVPQVSFAFSQWIENQEVTIQVPPRNVNGKVTIQGQSNHEVMLLVKKDNITKWYTVHQKKGFFIKNLYFTNGEGMYEIHVMVPIGNQYYVFGPKVEVFSRSSLNPFQTPDEDIESDDSVIKTLALEITKNKLTTYAKSKAIYEWVSKNIRYDMAKYKKIMKGQYDNEYGAIATLQYRKGVCYDYSTLIAALGRAAGLSVKVIKGNYTTNSSVAYHAWNEVFIPEQNRWISMDSTLGSIFEKNYFDSDMLKKTHQEIS